MKNVLIILLQLKIIKSCNAFARMGKRCSDSYIKELSDDPYIPAKIKMALNIAMRTIEMELELDGLYNR